MLIIIRRFIVLGSSSRILQLVSLLFTRLEEFALLSPLVLAPVDLLLTGIVPRWGLLANDRSSYVITFFFVMITAAVLAEICSALPAAGSIYLYLSSIGWAKE